MFLAQQTQIAALRAQRQHPTLGKPEPVRQPAIDDVAFGRALAESEVRASSLIDALRQKAKANPPFKAG